MRRLLLAALAGCLVAPASAQAAHPNALWRVVHDLCMVDHRLTGLSVPCVKIDPRRGVAVVPDPKRASHLLLVPTRRIVGIESAELQAPDAPNYWIDAWDARAILARRVGRPLEREDVGLAVNSRFGRSQEQLHIHIACVRAVVRRSLAAVADGFSTDAWRSWDLLPDRRYRVRLIRGETLGDNDPFRILAQTDPRAAAKMSWQTLVVLGARLPDGSPGFYLLSDRISVARNDSGHGEELLDHKCRTDDGAGSGTSAAPVRPRVGSPPSSSGAAQRQPGDPGVQGSRVVLGPRVAPAARPRMTGILDPA